MKMAGIEGDEPDGLMVVAALAAVVESAEWPAEEPEP
jgi:hypothetical protein